MKNKFFAILLVILVLILTNCKTQKDAVYASIQTNKEVWEDSMKMAECIRYQALVENAVFPFAETQAVQTDSIGTDAADDPAIWYNKKNPEESLIIGTNKQLGLHLYDLNGQELQFLSCGEINNVDVRDGFPFLDKNVVLVAATNRTEKNVSLFVLDTENKKLSDKISSIPTELRDVYGLCMYKSVDGFYVFVNGRSGRFEQWYVFSKKDKIRSRLVRKWKVESQPEGMVVDDETGLLYLGVEEKGIYILNINKEDFSVFPDEADLRVIPESKAGSNPFIKYDIKGLALLECNDQKYLIASIQGNFSYAVFHINKNNRYLTSFKIVGKSPDGAEETSGIEICSQAIGSRYPNGILVVQDGFNYRGQKLINQNFKIVSLKEILPFLE